MITFSGLASGIDTDSLVSGLVRLERAPIDRLEQQSSDLTARATKLTQLRNDLEALRTAAGKLDTRRELQSSTVRSSNEDIVTATANGEAVNGSYNVHVNALAQATRAYSDGFGAQDTTGLFGASGTLDIQVGSDPAFSITIDNTTDTLTTIASKINSASDRVRAGIFYDGTNYRLQVQGTETGLANAVTFTENGGVDLGLTDPLNLRQAAQDASVDIDGFTVTSETNTISGAVPGVTFTVNRESDPGVDERIEIVRDPEALKGTLNEFISAYNKIATFIQRESTVVSGVQKGADSLIGDPVLRTVQSRLRDVMGREVSPGSGQYTTLSSLGVETQRDGTLSLDENDFETALAADPEAVSRVLSDESSGVMVSLSSSIRELTLSGTGVISLRISSINNRKRELATTMEGMERRVTSYEERLRSQFQQMEQVISGLQNQQNQMLSILNGATASGGAGGTL